MFFSVQHHSCFAHQISYAFGIILWEIWTGGRAFAGWYLFVLKAPPLFTLNYLLADTPEALLGHRVAVSDLRPVFPLDAPPEYVALAQKCWDRNAEQRCVVRCLTCLSKCDFTPLSCHPSGPRSSRSLKHSRLGWDLPTRILPRYHRPSMPRLR
jgi:hypothetical protein